MVSKVLRGVASYEELKKYQEDIHDPITSLPGLTPEQSKEINEVQKRLIKALQSPSLPVVGMGIPNDAGTVARVRKHASNAGARIRDLKLGKPESFDRIGRRALKEVKPSTGSTDQVREQTFVLVPSQLAGLIEGYLLVRMGLITNVKLHHDRRLFEAWLSGGEELDLEVTGIFLGSITRASKEMWTPILEGQLAIGKKLLGTPPTTPDDVQASFTISLPADQDDIYQAVVDRLRLLGPEQASIKPNEYALPNELLQRAVDTLAIGMDIKPKDLPSPARYVETELHRGGPEIGLRVATHGELSPYTNKNRHSHHTTQFLFAEYLTHHSSREPFGENEPGLKRAPDGTPETLYRADSKRPMQLGNLYDKNRGAPMPAILVAHTTHERSGLHVVSSKPVSPTDLGRASQGNTVHAWFTKEVQEGPKPTEQQKTDDEAADVAGMGDVLKARNRLLVSGVLNVYKEMGAHMMPALRTALRFEEKLYYETIAARADQNLSDEVLKPDKKLDPGKLADVYRRAEDNDRAVLAQYGVRS
jgi:hypothetical protein